jgi:hypothetical protein
MRQLEPNSLNRLWKQFFVEMKFNPPLKMGKQTCQWIREPKATSKTQTYKPLKNSQQG